VNLSERLRVARERAGVTTDQVEGRTGIPASGERICPDCKGRGRVPVTFPGGRNGELSCGTCYGRGKIGPSRNAKDGGSRT